MSFKSILLLCAQFLCMGYLIIHFSLYKNLFINGIQLLGVAIALWGIVTGGINKFNIQPEVKSDQLITKGPFSIIRNPMYIGVLLFFAPIVIVKSIILNWVIFGLLIVTLLLKIYREEQFLETKFGEQYLIYKTKTFRLIPFVY